MPPKRKTMEPSYKLYDVHSNALRDDDTLSDIVHVHKGAFPTIGHVNNKDTKVFVKLENILITRIATDTGFGRTQHKCELRLNQEQGVLVERIEKCLLSQIENTVIKRKLISSNVIKEKFKSNLSKDIQTYTLKAKIGHDRTAILLCDRSKAHGDASPLTWSDDDKDKIPQIFRDVIQDEFQYITIQPTVLYVLEDMTVGCSWDIKSVKHDYPTEDCVERQNKGVSSDNADDMDLIRLMPTIQFT